jgi:hypothetical protein
LCHSTSRARRAADNPCAWQGMDWAALNSKKLVAPWKPEQSRDTAATRTRHEQTRVRFVCGEVSSESRSHASHSGYSSYDETESDSDTDSDSDAGASDDEYADF